MNKKWMLLFMGCFAMGLAFITASSVLTGCAGNVPAVTTFVQTSTPTLTPTP